MKQLIVLLSVSACCLFPVNEAQAQSEKKKAKGGFSQLEFDQPVVETDVKTKVKDAKEKSVEELTVEDLQNDPTLLLKLEAPPLDSSKPSPAVDEPTPKKPEVEKKEAKKTKKKRRQLSGDARAKSTRRKLSDADDFRFVIPRLKGPFADEDDPNTITAKATWNKRRRKSRCGEVDREAQLCGKKKSLEELLKRLTGNTEFFEYHCRNACDGPNEFGVLTGIQINDLRGGSFRILEEGRNCRYQIARPKGGKWLMLETNAVVCSCLRNACR